MTPTHRANAIRRRRGRVYNLPRADRSQPDQMRVFYTPRTDAGVHVDEDTALQFSAVYAAVRLISTTLATLEWEARERRRTGGSDRAMTHPVDRLLAVRMNREMNPDTFVETLCAHALTWGNGYAEIERDSLNRPLAMWPITPDRVRVRRDGAGTLYYEVYQSAGGVAEIVPENMFHIPNIGYDGVCGYSPVTLARQSIGLGIAMERSGGALFGNGGIPMGVLKHPGKVTQEVADKTRALWQDTHGGPSKSHRLAITGGGVEFVPLNMPHEDAQWLEGRKFQVSEIARWFGVPPHKIGDLERATFDNIEHQSIEFVQDTLLRWVRRFENEANRKLFAASSGTRYFTRMRTEQLLRADTEKRSAYYMNGWQMGVFSANEVREMEGLNPIGPTGDKRFVQLNLTTLENAGEQPEPADEPSPPEEAMREPIRDAINRANRRAANCMQQAEKRGDEVSAEWWDRHAGYVSDALQPHLSALCAMLGVSSAGIADQFAAEHLGKQPDPEQSADQLITKCLGEDR